MAKKIGGLGRGLESLFTENTAEQQSPVNLRLTDIEPNRSQPRKDFDEEALSDLADSISKHGLLQPLLVRPLPNGTYQIVAGERRWRASRMAGLDTVPAIVKEMTDQEALEVALIENLQREDLNPVEEALGYRTLIEEYGMTQEMVAERVGKSRSAVANALRLLALSDDILQLVKENKISAGHARALLSLEGELLKKGVELALKGAPVRVIERFAKLSKQARKEPAAKDRFYSEAELALSSELGRKVKISASKNKGVLQIEFYNKEDLSEIIDRITGVNW
ncbi:MAG TPA: ParB/RepB/Spo0J family partition protein [Clostridiales bacterium]|nr:ParB/RepB/Spo0J family partition protein [Clostridiales bacterium]